MAGGSFSGVVHDGDGDLVGPLEVPEVAEKCSDFLGIVLVSAVKADEWVEQEEARFVALNGGGEALDVVREIEA